MRWFARLLHLLRRGVIGARLDDAHARNAAAARRLDAAVREVLKR